MPVEPDNEAATITPPHSHPKASLLFNGLSFVFAAAGFIAERFTGQTEDISVLDFLPGVLATINASLNLSDCCCKPSAIYPCLRFLLDAGIIGINIFRFYTEGWLPNEATAATMTAFIMRYASATSSLPDGATNFVDTARNIGGNVMSWWRRRKTDERSPLVSSAPTSASTSTSFSPGPTASQ